MLSWQDFQKKFGTKTTSNIDLYKFAKILKIKNFHVIMNDELGTLFQSSAQNTIKKKNPLNVITNLHSSNQPGIHWNCFLIVLSSSFIITWKFLSFRIFANLYKSILLVVFVPNFF